MFVCLITVISFWLQLLRVVNYAFFENYSQKGQPGMIILDAHMDVNLMISLEVPFLNYVELLRWNKYTTWHLQLIKVEAFIYITATNGCLWTRTRSAVTHINCEQQINLSKSKWFSWNIVYVRPEEVSLAKIFQFFSHSCTL